jgi:hypothetical protein
VPRSLSRRELLRLSGGGGLLLAGGPALAGLISRVAEAQAASELVRRAPRARWWVAAAAQGADCLACHDGPLDRGKRHLHGKTVRCLLCARRCLLQDGERGMCRARVNVG